MLDNRSQIRRFQSLLKVSLRFLVLLSSLISIDFVLNKSVNNRKLPQVKCNPFEKKVHHKSTDIAIIGSKHSVMGSVEPPNTVRVCSHTDTLFARYALWYCISIFLLCASAPCLSRILWWAGCKGTWKKGVFILFRPKFCTKNFSHLHIVRFKRSQITEIFPHLTFQTRDETLKWSSTTNGGSLFSDSYDSHNWALPLLEHYPKLVFLSSDAVAISPSLIYTPKAVFV